MDGLWRGGLVPVVMVAYRHLYPEAPLRAILAIDSDNSHSGVVLYEATDPIHGRLLGCQRIVMVAGDPSRSVEERIMPAVRELLALRPGAAVAMERPAPTARRDVNHGHQAVIGDAQGWLSGLIAGFMRAEGLLPAWPARYTSSDWMPTMRAVAAARGILVDASPVVVRSAAAAVVVDGVRIARGKPTATRTAGGGLQLSYPCGHRLVLADMLAVSRAPGQCASCAGTSAVPAARPVDDPAERRRRRKAAAVRFLAAVAPDHLARIEGEARAKATKATASTPPWDLAGVDDVADALGVAVHAAAQLFADAQLE